MQSALVTDDEARPAIEHATHTDPVWRERANFIVQVDLQHHGMASGAYEQLWTRTGDQIAFEVCCLPFFTYGIALGDVIVWNDVDRQAVVTHRSGRRIIRCAFANRVDAATEHEAFHGSVVSTGALVEFHGPGFAAIDINSDESLGAVLAVVGPLHESGRATWEWGSE